MDATSTPTCPNCGEPQPGRYCPQCGQRQGPRITSLHHILREALDDQLSINGTLPRTVASLLARPGRLTNEYLRGRVMRYVPPFRLYLVTSVIFFLVVSIVGQVRPETLIQMDAGSPSVEGGIVEADRRPVRFTRGAPGFFGISINADTAAAGDSITVALNIGNERMNQRLEARLRELVPLSPGEMLSTVLPDVLERIPTAMFVMVPLFAGILWLLYLRQKRYYVEHFVFALHTHAFTFLTFTLMFAVQQTPLPGVLMLWVFFYYWLAMRRVYSQGWFVTTLKYGVLSFVYSLLLGFALAGAILVALVLG